MGLVNIGVSGLFQMMLFTSILLDMHVCLGVEDTCAKATARTGTKQSEPKARQEFNRQANPTREALIGIRNYLYAKLDIFPRKKSRTQVSCGCG